MMNIKGTGVVLLLATALTGVGCGSADLEAENQRLEGELDQLRQDHQDKVAELLQRIDELNLQTSGSFRHANGEELPW